MVSKRDLHVGRAMPPPVLKDGEVVSSRYRVAGNKPIGAGQFAEVFRALDQTSDQRSPTFVAIKIEREEKTTSREVRALQDLQGCPGVCRLLGQGSHRNQHPFIVMQLGGENLADIRHTRVAERRHSKSTIAWIGVRVLDTLRAIHARGYVHRDVKPSNITVAPRGSGAGSAERELLLIDLGLAKKFETKEAREASARDREEGEAADERVAFRGSTTYASVNAHAGIEQGPRDDLWSLLYALAEMHEGTLPWRGLKDKGAADDESVKRSTHDLKKKALAEPKTLCPTRGTPDALVRFSKRLERVANAHDEPDYDRLRSILQSLDDRPLDWEVSGGDGVSAATASGAAPASYAAVAGNDAAKDKEPLPRTNQTLPMSKVKALIEHKASVPPLVQKWVEKIGEELDAGHAADVVSGVCAAAIETSRLEDPYVEEYVLRLLDEAAQAGKDGRAYVEDRRNKRKR